MITCRRCQREHESDVGECVCGADLAIDGIRVDGSDPLPDLPAPIGEDDPFEKMPKKPAPRPQHDPPPSAKGERSLHQAGPVVPLGGPSPRPKQGRPNPLARTPTFGDEESSIIDPAVAKARAKPKPEPEAAPPAAAPPPAPPGDVAPIVPDRISSGGVERPSVGLERPTTGPDGGMLPARRPPAQRLAVELHRSCSQCGRALIDGRSFCDCSALVAQSNAVEEHEDSSPPAKAKWWRKLTGTGVNKQGDNRTWSQRAKDTGARKGLRYASQISSRTRFGRIAMVALAGGGLIAVLGPFKTEARRLPRLLVPAEEVLVNENILPAPLRGDDPETAAGSLLQLTWPFADDFRLDPTTASEREHSTECPAGGIAALRGAQSSSTGTTAAPAADGPVDVPFLNANFPGSSDLVELWFQVGPTRGNLDTSDIADLSGENVPWRQPVERPSQIAVALFDGDDTEVSCRLLSVVDSSERQVFNIDEKDVVRFELLVTEVFDHGSDVVPALLISDVSWIED